MNRREFIAGAAAAAVVPAVIPETVTLPAAKESWGVVESCLLTFPARPVNPYAGALWFDLTREKFELYNGTDWTEAVVDLTQC